MPGHRAHEGLQPPSNPKERKVLKETQSTAQVHSTAHLHPLEPAGQSPHSGCDQGLIRQLRSLLRPSPAHWRHCGNLRRYVRRAQHCSSHCAAKSPYFPCTFPSAEPSNGMGTALGSGPDLDQSRTPACGTLGALPRRTRGTVLSTGTATPPAGAARTPARSPQGQGRRPGRLPHQTPYPTVYFLQCSTTAPPRFGEKTTTSAISFRACTPPLLVSIKGGGGLYLIHLGCSTHLAQLTRAHTLF